jgi:hypothetical protein
MGSISIRAALVYYSVLYTSIANFYQKSFCVMITTAQKSETDFSCRGLLDFDAVCADTSYWRWRRHGPLKRWHRTTTLHGAISQRTSTWNITAVRASKLAGNWFVSTIHKKQTNIQGYKMASNANGKHLYSTVVQLPTYGAQGQDFLWTTAMRNKIK